MGTLVCDDEADESDDVVDDVEDDCDDEGVAAAGNDVDEGSGVDVPIA